VLRRACIEVTSAGLDKKPITAMDFALVLIENLVGIEKHKKFDAGLQRPQPSNKLSGSGL
jgi:hypothetical protein